MTNEFRKLNDVMQAQKQVLVKKDALVEGMWVTLLSGEHGVLFGPPGVVKSMIVDDTARYFPGFTYFSHLMGKTTVPEELYGPVSITQLRNDKYEHKIESYLPDSDIAFLDEGFKAGATILNTLLKLMNERKFRNGTETISVPLKTMLIASNELPTESELNALYDRFLFRFLVEDLQFAEDFKKLLDKEDEIREFLAAPPTETFSDEEYATMRKHVDQVEVPADIKGAIVDIRETLEMEHQIRASSRRWLKTLKGIRAHAALHGRTEAVEEDLLPLVNMLWSQPQEIDKVKEVVWNVANPILYLAYSFRDVITMLMSDLDTALKKAGNERDKDMVSSEYRAKLSQEITNISEAKRALTKSQEKEFGDKFAYMIKVLEGGKIRLVVEAGGIDRDSVPDAIVEWKPETI